MRFLKDSKMILFIALPLLFSRFVDMVVFFIGFVLIAKLGPLEFAASSLATSVYVTVIVIAIGILYALGIKMSQAFGAKDYEKIRGYFYGGVVLAIFLFVAASVLIFLISYLLPYLGQKPELIPVAKEFMHAMCLAMLPTLFTIVINQVVTVLLKPRVVFFTSILNAVVTISCFYPLIFGGFGIPALGPWGFGLSLFIGNFSLVLVTIIYILQTDYFKQFELFNFSGIKSRLLISIKEIFQLGFPMGVQFGAEIAAFSVITFLLGRFGINALVAAQIAQQVIVLVLVIPFTMSEAAAILVGRSFGENNLNAVRSYGFSSQKLVTLFLLFFSGIFFICPRQVAGFYINVNDPNMAGVVSLSILFLYVAAAGQLFDGLRNTLSGALRGLNDSKYPMYVGIFVMWCVALPFGIYFAFKTQLGPVGFPIGSAIAFFIGAIILFVRFNNKTKDKINACTKAG